jgi:predicted nucleotide-binding protein (sugar kinase/HSP70/actin superfamily)
MLSKLTYRVRPYEKTAGDADAALARWRGEASRAMEAQEEVIRVVARAGRDFARIPQRRERRPLVGIVGEIYVRNNPFSNEELVRRIEGAGGEAWLAPIPEWILFTTWQDAFRQEPWPLSPRQLLERGKRRLRLHFMQKGKHDFWKAAGSLLAEREEPPIAEIVRAGQPYIPFNVGGEVLISMGRSVHFVRQGVSLVVNASPFGCMAGTIAASLFARFEKDLEVPVLNLFYEGTGGVNQLLDVFLANLGGREALRPPAVPVTTDVTVA